MKHDTTHEFWHLTGIFTETFLQKNVVLVQAAGLCPILAAGVSLQNGVVLTVCTMLILVSCGLFMSLVGGKLSAWLRPVVYTVLATVLLVGTSYVLDAYISHELYSKLYLFIPLMAVSTLVTTRVGGFSAGNRLSASLVDALGASLGFGAVICLVSALREITISNTLWGRTLPIKLSMPEVSLTFAAYLLLGFMAALLQAWISHRRRRLEKRGDRL